MARTFFDVIRPILTACVLGTASLTGLAAPTLAQTTLQSTHDKFGSFDCPRSHVPALDLPLMKQAIRNNAEVVIVALGSSSTQGWHSTDIAHSYPAILQAELQAALPASHIAIINRGVGGQDAMEMVPRLGADALAVRPSLVIWQLGANAAMQHGDPNVFRDLVTQGVATLQASKVDVVLMDNQRSPLVLASPDRAAFDQALSDVAARSGAGLFSRGALMDQWQAEGHPYSQFVSDDGVHHNDRGYRCMAKALAGSILDGLGVVPAPIRSASRR